MIIKSLITFIFMLYKIFSQEIPKEFIEYNQITRLIDSGQNWSRNSIFGNYRFQNIEKSTNLDKNILYIKTRLGSYSVNKNIALYGFGHFKYQNFLYGYLYPRIVNNSSYFPRYSGVPREISRYNFNSGETDLSGIGFQNNWLLFQFGRGRENWGAGESIQIALSDNSPAYDYFLLSSNYGKINVKYFHGFLESNEEKINRFITGRGLEWKNNESLNIGISEIVIYSGKDRSLDFAYINPLSTHLEIELNNRLNMIGSEDANAIWQLSIDWLVKNNLRLSSNFIYDEFVLDKIELDKGKEFGKAFSMRIAYTPIKRKEKTLTVFTSLINIGTPTFRHGQGYNNFIQRGKPIGWKNGSDTQEFILGLNYYYMENYILNISVGKSKTGEESITFRPYEEYADYLKSSFPSGVIKNKLYFKSKLQWWVKSNISTNLTFNSFKIDLSNYETYFAIGLDVYFLKNFRL